VEIDSSVEFPEGPIGIIDLEYFPEGPIGVEDSTGWTGSSGSHWLPVPIGIIIDPTYLVNFPEGPIGFPEGPIGVVAFPEGP